MKKKRKKQEKKKKNDDEEEKYYPVTKSLKVLEYTIFFSLSSFVFTKITTAVPKRRQRINA